MGNFLRRELTEEQFREKMIEEEAMPLLPVNIHLDDRRVLANILYDTDILFDYLNAAKKFDDDAKFDSNVPFSKYFDADTCIKTDPETGRITYLNLIVNYTETNGDDDSQFIYYELPPIIGQLNQLKEIRLWGCKLIPKEIGDLPKLEKLDLIRCRNGALETIPEKLKNSTSTVKINVLQTTDDVMTVRYM